MAKKKVYKEKKEEKIRKIENGVVLKEEGKKKILCPECGKEVTQNLEMVDYGIRNDGVLFFIKKCLNCNIGVRYFTSSDCKIFYTSESEIPKKEKKEEEVPKEISPVDKLLENLQSFILKMEKQAEERLARESANKKQEEEEIKKDNKDKKKKNKVIKFKLKG